jgi:WD40 repeat protein
MTLPAAATPLASGEPGTPSPSFTFVGAGARLLWLDGDALRSQELSTGAATSLPLEPVWAYGPLSVSPDGTLVVAREGHALSSWSLDTRELEPVSDSHWLPVFSLAVSPEGALVATSDDGGSVRLWELARGQCIGELALKTARDCLRFSPDGQWLAMGTAQGQLHLWSRGAGRVLHSFPAHKAPLQALAFSPDGGWLATCSQQGGEVAVWAVPGGERRRVLDSGSERLTALDCSPDGQWLVAGGMDGTLTFWSMPEGRPIHRVHAPDSSVHQVRFFPDGQRVLSAGLLDTDHPDDGPGQPMLQLWHTETGRLLTSRRAHAFPLAIAPDGRSLFHVPWRNPALCMEDAMTGEAPQTLGAVPEPECHAFSSDFSVWVTGHRDCTALVWDVARWGLTPELP